MNEVISGSLSLLQSTNLGLRSHSQGRNDFYDPLDRTVEQHLLLIIFY